MEGQYMQETEKVRLEGVSEGEIAEFQQMAYAYWQELMPHATVVRDVEQRKSYFDQRFTQKGDNADPHWAVVDGRKIGFVLFEISPENKSATLEDFYVAPSERRKGYGSAMVRAMCAYFDTLGVERIELNVRRDNPDALSFWEAQGFRIALYHLRQYRDPQAGIGFIGGLSSDFATNPDS
jgi:ribosomal protein S18 acetylase RimI-like enzyme